MDIESATCPREDRVEVSILARLLFPIPDMEDEVVPVVIKNISASGLLLATDHRFSSLLPPYLGTHAIIEFFFEDLEFRRAPIEIVRAEKLPGHQIFIGCRFIDLPAETRLDLRASVAVQLATPMRSQPQYRVAFGRS